MKRFLLILAGGIVSTFLGTQIAKANAIEDCATQVV